MACSRRIGPVFMRGYPKPEVYNLKGNWFLSLADARDGRITTVSDRTVSLDNLTPKEFTWRRIPSASPMAQPPEYNRVGSRKVSSRMDQTRGLGQELHISSLPSTLKTMTPDNFLSRSLFGLRIYIYSDSIYKNWYLWCQNSDTRCQGNFTFCRS